MKRPGRDLFRPADIPLRQTATSSSCRAWPHSEGRVLRFDKSGKFIKSWGGKGAADGQFDQPHSLLVDRQNRL
jgi:hypothetical protein